MPKKGCFFNLPVDLHRKLRAIAFYKESNMTSELIYIVESWYRIMADLNKDNKRIQEILKNE